MFGKKHLLASAMLAVTLFVVSVSTIFVYVACASTRVWPLGHVNEGSVSGRAVKLPCTRPFVGSKVPAAVTVPLKDRLFEAFGLCPPLLMQA
jgi:hypothetical protein